MCAPRRTREVPTLLARGEPRDSEHERRWLAGRGVEGAAPGNGANARCDHTLVVEHDVAATHSHVDIERNSGVRDRLSVAIDSHHRGTATARHAGKQVQTISA